MGYGFRHVLMVQKAQASKLKPHIGKNEDLNTLSTGNLPAATTLSQFWLKEAVNPLHLLSGFFGWSFTSKA